jgi:hypothetical protein
MSGDSVKNTFFTRVLCLSPPKRRDFARDWIAFKTQPQFPKKGRLSTSESHGYFYDLL